MKACPHCVDEETELNKPHVSRVAGGGGREAEKEGTSVCSCISSFPGELNEEVKMPMTAEHKANPKGFIQPHLNLTLARGTSRLLPARN